MQLKEGVSLDGLRPEINIILPLVESCFARHGKEITLTCTTGSHGPEDPHTHGFAIDIRMHDYMLSVQLILISEVKKALPPEYFSQLEYAGNERAHIHVQYRRELWRAIVAQERENQGVSQAGGIGDRVS